MGLATVTQPSHPAKYTDALLRPCSPASCGEHVERSVLDPMAGIGRKAGEEVSKLVEAILNQEKLVLPPFDQVLELALQGIHPLGRNLTPVSDILKTNVPPYALLTPGRQ